MCTQIQESHAQFTKMCWHVEMVGEYLQVRSIMAQEGVVEMSEELREKTRMTTW